MCGALGSLLWMIGLICRDVRTSPPQKLEKQTLIPVILHRHRQRDSRPMFTLSADSLDRGYQAILHHGYSDFFPEPPEFEAVKKGWDKLRTILGNIDLT